MIPPMSGKHANAAATFDGNPVVPDGVCGSEDNGGGGGGGEADAGGIGSTGSAIALVYKKIFVDCQANSSFVMSSGVETSFIGA